MHVIFLGLSITSSWGNGHATNYRALARELAVRGHHVTFCERDVPWYAEHRDLAAPGYAELVLYRDLDELWAEAGRAVRSADLVVVGSYVPDGVAVSDWVLATATGITAFYDLDTPVTLNKLDHSDHEYLAPWLIPEFDLYLSFTGGPVLDGLRLAYGARRPIAFYCLVDPTAYRPVPTDRIWDLGYLGTFSEDRQAVLDALLIGPARKRSRNRFVVAGPRYPEDVAWPPNVERIAHLPPRQHPAFYCGQRFTLNVTRAHMRRVGWSPSVRLFEAAACGTAIISDRWAGLEDVFDPEREIFVVDGAEEVLRLLDETSEAHRDDVARAARRRVLRDHTAARRIDLLENEVAALAGTRDAA